MARFRIAAVVLALAAALEACAPSQRDVTAPAELIAADSVGADGVEVELREYGFDMHAVELSAGPIEFKVRNVGSELHEFVVVPVEDGRYGMPAAEVEALRPGRSGGVRLALTPGRYELVCLISKLSESGAVSHLSLGMRTPFTVGGS